MVSSAWPSIENRDWKLLTVGTWSMSVTEHACPSQVLGFSPNSLLVYSQVFQKVENYTGVFSICLYCEVSNRCFSVVKTDEFCAAEGLLDLILLRVLLTNQHIKCCRCLLWTLGLFM